MPMSDQVPELKNRKSFSSAGTARTAEPVSCVGGRTTSQSKPTSSRTSGDREPRRYPGWRSSPKIRRGTPRRSMRSKSQERVFASRSWVVLAFVYSAEIWPVSRKCR